MIKNDKITIIITSIIILLNSILGLIFWGELDENLPIHFNLNGDADGFGTKAFFVFGIPLIMLVLHLVCSLVFYFFDENKKMQSRKIYSIIYWIFPIIGTFTSIITYMNALGFKTNFAESAIFFILGVPFIYLGNYLPKCKRNFSLGIKLPWTYKSEENWNKTHRFAGKVWFIGGILFLIFAFIKIKIRYIVMVLIFLMMIILPTLYSYVYFLKQVKNGMDKNGDGMLVFTKNQRKLLKVSFVIVPIILIIVSILLFVGEVTVSLNDNTLSVGATFSGTSEISLDEIEEIDLRDDVEVGTRIFGVSSARLLSGSFSNEEFGSYTRYTYVNNKTVIVIKTKDNTFILNLKTPSETEEIFTKIKMQLLKRAPVFFRL